MYYICFCVPVFSFPPSVRVLGQPYSLTSFGLSGWLFERLNNVYGYEGSAINFTLPIYFEGGVRLCGGIGTVLGPGFGALGFFLGVGDGVDLL